MPEEWQAIWPDWKAVFARQPATVRRLSAGRSNTSWLIQEGKHRYVLRLATQHDDQLGVDHGRLLPHD